MPQNKMLAYLVIFIVIFNNGLVTGRKSTSTQPHVVFIIADDMGWNDVSFHGADQIPTPNIDALAYNGVILNRHYVLPICTPSRTSFLTSRYAIRDGMQGIPLVPGEPRGIPLDIPLLPEYLRDLGYATHLVGKWHVGYHTQNHTPVQRGFDSFFGYYNGLVTYYNSTVYGTRKKTIPGYDLHHDLPQSFNMVTDKKYFTDLVTDKAEEIIKKNGNEKPLFLEVSHLAPHASEADDPLEVRDPIENDRTFSYITDEKRRKYAGLMQAMDESVGRVVRALSEANMIDNSIIVFIADNGAPTVGMYENSGSNYPFRGIKNTTFEGGIRGAACIFSPLIKTPSRVSNELMHITDWLPTLYAAAGGNPEKIRNIDGLNQWPAITSNKPSPRKSFLVNIDESSGNAGVLVGKYKLVRRADPSTDDYYGEAGNDLFTPSYRVKDVLSSPASLAIKKIEGFNSVTLPRAIQLRKQSTVHCKSVLKSVLRADCSNACLFDVQNDPCETTNLSTTLPKIFKNLKLLLKDYRKVLMPQPANPVDPCGYPEYFNGYWMPWRLDNVSYTNGTCQRPIYA